MNLKTITFGARRQGPRLQALIEQKCVPAGTRLQGKGGTGETGIQINPRQESALCLRLIQSANADAAMPIGRSEGFEVAIMSQVARKMANREANALINDARTDIGWLTSQLCRIRLASRLIGGNAHDPYPCGLGARSL